MKKPLELPPEVARAFMKDLRLLCREEPYQARRDRGATNVRVETGRRNHFLCPTKHAYPHPQARDIKARRTPHPAGPPLYCAAP